MKVLITGGAGCIGCRLASRLLKEGHTVTVYDNLTSGKMEHIQDFLENEHFSFIKGDVMDSDKLGRALKGMDIVYHAAANPDIKYSEGEPTDKDLKQNTLGTYSILEAMRKAGVKKIVFFSSSAVYGFSEKASSEESATNAYSLYGASKIAGEALVQAYCSMFSIQGWIFRLANVIGPQTRKKGRTAISDFIANLRENNKALVVLGNGKQKKSYIYVDECIDGILFAVGKAKDRINIFNLGPQDAITVEEIAKIVIKEMGLNAKINYTGGEGGWTGDIPRFLLDTSKMKRLGWKPKYSSEEAVRKTVPSLLR